MPINPQHEGSLTFIDASEEKTSVRIYFGEITAVSLPGFLTDFGAFRSATEAIVKGSLVGDSWSGDVTKYNNVAPTDQDAQRERKFLVVYQGNTTFSKYRMEIGTADIIRADVMIPGTDKVDLEEALIAAWVTAFEQLARTPEGENVTVLSMNAVGRNL